MARDIELGTGITIVPRSLLSDARNIDGHRARVFIVYPDDSTGAQVAEIVEDIKVLAKIEAGIIAPKEKNEHETHDSDLDDPDEPDAESDRLRDGERA